MYNANKNFPDKLATLCKRILIAVSLSGVLLSCQKEAPQLQQKQPSNSKTPVSGQPVLLQASTSSVQLLQANASRTALNLQWSGFPVGSEESQDYRIEAAMAGTQFTDWVEIGSTGQSSIDFTVEDFNKQIRKLFVTGFEEDVLLRVKYNRKDSGPLYSTGASLQVSSYQPIVDYDNSKVFRIPGNFENWKVDQAQKIVSPKMNGEYEGYINFSNTYSQFLMIKTDAYWNALTTYYYIGASKFGFGGTMFSLMDGAGVYKLNANTNTNTWSYTKINSWSVNGTAITADGNSDVEMVANPNNVSWQITGNFKEGSFIFRANKSNAIVFGHNAASETGAADYNGSKITIPKAGNYFIELCLSSAGNYYYSLQRNS